MPIVFDCPYCSRTHHADHRYAGREVFCKRCAKPIRVPKDPSAASKSAAPAKPAAKKVIATSCPNCGRGHRVDAKFGGKLIKCKGCQQPFRVPTAGGTGVLAGDSMAGEMDPLQVLREEAERTARLQAERKAEVERQEREAAEEAEAERLSREQAERAAKDEAERKAREEAQRAAKAEAERLAREEAERAAKAEAEKKARQEEERAAKAEAERLAREEAERKVVAQRVAQLEEQKRVEAERLAKEKAEAERLARLEAERLAREEAERQAKLEAQRKAEAARLEAERAKAEAERLAREEAARKAEAERVAKLERERAERLAKEEAERQARLAAERELATQRAAKAEAERRARLEAQRKAEAERAAKAEAERAAKEAERVAKLEAERAAKADAERKAAAERAAKAEAERLVREEAARAKAEAERLAREEAARAKAEADRLAKLEAEQKAKAAAEKKAREEAARQAIAERDRLAREEAERRAKARKEQFAREQAERLLRLEDQFKARTAAEQAAKKAQRAAAPAVQPNAPLPAGQDELAAKARTDEATRAAAQQAGRAEAERAAKAEAELAAKPVPAVPPEETETEEPGDVDSALTALSATQTPRPANKPAAASPEQAGVKGFLEKLKRGIWSKPQTTAVAPSSQMPAPAPEKPRETPAPAPAKPIPLIDIKPVSFVVSHTGGETLGSASEPSHTKAPGASNEVAQPHKEVGGSAGASEASDNGAEPPMAIFSDETGAPPDETPPGETVSATTPPELRTQPVHPPSEVEESARSGFSPPMPQVVEAPPFTPATQVEEEMPQPEAVPRAPVEVEARVREPQRPGEEEEDRESPEMEPSGLLRQSPQDRSPGGSTILRHQPRTGTSPVAPPLTPYLPHIAAHIERTIGRAPIVFHEIISIGIHIDLHVIPPTTGPATPAHPRGTSHFTVVTSGLSSRPMNIPAGNPCSPHAELMICLPVDWPGLRLDGTFDSALMRDETNWWPLRWLKAIARMPHEYNTFIGPGHTIPNGPAAAPFSRNTALGCMLVQPSLLNPHATKLVVSNNVTIDFLALWPIYREEMVLKQEKGVEALVRRFTTTGTSELIQLDRKNVARR